MGAPYGHNDILEVRFAISSDFWELLFYKCFNPEKQRTTERVGKSNFFGDDRDDHDDGGD